MLHHFADQDVEDNHDDHPHQDEGKLFDIHIYRFIIGA